MVRLIDKVKQNDTKNNGNVELSDYPVEKYKISH